MTAQREFVEIWIIFVFVILTLDVFEAHRSLVGTPELYVEWGLIVALSFASWRGVGWLFRLAPGDVAALAAAASLLVWWLVPIYFAIAKVTSWWLGPLLVEGGLSTRSCRS